MKALSTRRKTMQTQARAVTPTARDLGLLVAVAVMFVCMLLTAPRAQAEDLAHESPETDTAELFESELIELGVGLDSHALDSNRAKAMLEIEKIFINDQDLNGTVSGNTAINSNNGANTIGGNAFDSASGFVNTIQNTGNNVLIQSATIVNVSIED